MTTVDEITVALQAHAEGTPYTISKIPGGVLVHLDVADLSWMTLLRQNRVTKEYSIEVTFDQADHAYRKEQIVRELSWTAGVEPGTFVPVVAARRSVQRGTVVEKRFSMQLGVEPSGRVGPVGYSFDSTEMSRFVDDVMKPSGWTKKMDRSTRLGLIVAGSVVGGIVVAGLIVLVVLLIVL